MGPGTGAVKGEPVANRDARRATTRISRRSERISRNGLRDRRSVSAVVLTGFGAVRLRSAPAGSCSAPSNRGCRREDRSPRNPDRSVIMPDEHGSASCTLRAGRSLTRPDGIPTSVLGPPGGAESLPFGWSGITAGGW
jgi:hypothetical protein